MSTCNFSQPNLSKIYALEDIEGDEYGELIQENIDNIAAEIDKNTDFKIVENNKWVNNKKIICEEWFYYFDKDYEQEDCYRVYITVESGYYSGCMIDADISEVPELSPKEKEELQKELDKVEKILESTTTPLRKIATFSNGEAVYEKV